MCPSLFTYFLLCVSVVVIQSGGDGRAKVKNEKPVETVAGAWISVGLIVKVMNNKIQQGKYYEAKGTILKVHPLPSSHARLAFGRVEGGSL